MNQIDDLFDRMDAWRHLPSYQLERRADGQAPTPARRRFDPRDRPS